MRKKRIGFQFRLADVLIVQIFGLLALAWQKAVRDPLYWEVRDEIDRAILPAAVMSFLAASVIGWRKRIFRVNYPDRRLRNWERWVYITLTAECIGFVIAAFELVAIEIERRGYRSYSPSMIHPGIVELFIPSFLLLFSVAGTAFAISGIAFAGFWSVRFAAKMLRKRLFARQSK